MHKLFRRRREKLDTITRSNTLSHHELLLLILLVVKSDHITLSWMSRALFAQDKSTMRQLLLIVCWLSLTRAQSPSDICRNSLDFIASREASQSESNPRVYKLCPGSYRVTQLDYSMIPVRDGMSMIPLRSNLKIQCGENGARENGCFLADGDVLLDGTKSFGVVNNRVDNVVIEGLTFANAGRYAVWINKPGSVTFRDCEFRNMTDLVVPVFLDYFDGNNMGSELRVSFENCIFRDNRFNFTHDYKPHNAALPRDPQIPALVLALGKQNRLTFDRTKFENNDMATNERFGESYLVQTSGQITMKNSCFVGNKVTTAPILRSGKLPFSLENNFGSTPSRCELFAGFSSIAQLDRSVPQCIGSLDATRCEADATRAPTPSPTPASTPRPTPPPTPQSTSGTITDTNFLLFEWKNKRPTKSQSTYSLFGNQYFTLDNGGRRRFLRNLSE